MLFTAMHDVHVKTENTLMVGDSEEDREAAKAAGIRFLHADKFFSHGIENEDDGDSKYSLSEK